MAKEYQNLICSICGNFEPPIKKNNLWCCKYCGALRPDPSGISSEIKISLNMAHNFRQNADFNNALKTYESILAKDADLEEANWGALVSEYGIEFVKEKNKFIPTVHRLNSNAVNRLPYYAKLSDEHKKLADEIENVRIKVWQQYEKIPSYDVFICYKETEYSDNNINKPTQESKWARDLYETLTYKCNLKVFYAPKSLVSSNDYWESHIYAALRSARLMIVLASSIEHINAPWVKNEWSRFSEFAKEQGANDKIIRVMLSGIDPGMLPADLRNRQVFDRDQSWEESLFDSVKELFDTVPQIERKDYSEAKVGTKQAVKQTITKRKFEKYTEKSSISEKTELENARILGLELGKFGLAIQMCDSIIEKNKGCHDAYWIKALAENKCKNDEQFKLTNGVANMATLEAAIATADEKKQSKIVALLHDKILKTNDFNIYREYITFPCVNSKDYDDLTKHFFKIASDNCYTNMFDTLIKTISDVDEYLNMHLTMIKKLDADGTSKHANKILDYVQNILDHDRGNKFALWKNYCLKHNLYNISQISSYVLSLNDFKELDSLYEYGYNDSASNTLVKICHDGVKNNNQDSYKLFDYLLKLIPPKNNLLFEEILNGFISVLFQCGYYSQIGKYNDQLFALDKYYHKAHFNRLLIKYKTYNLMTLLPVYDELVMDEHFNAAINAYGTNHPNEKNIYRQFYIDLGIIRDQVRNDAKKGAHTYQLLFSNEEKEKYTKWITKFKHYKFPFTTYRKFRKECNEIWDIYEQKMRKWNVPIEDYYRRIESIWSPDQIGGVPPKVAFSIDDDAKSWKYAHEKFYNNTFAKGDFLSKDPDERRQQLRQLSKRRRRRGLGSGNGNVIIKLSIIAIILGALIFGVVQCERWRTGFKFSLSDDGTYYICMGPNFFLGKSEIIIPDTYKGLPVMAIGDEAFTICRYSSVQIPDSVTYIGKKAFQYGKFDSVTIPNSVTYIGERAFAECKNLNHIVIPDSVTSIGNYAFYDCNNLTSIEFSNGVTDIGDHAFDNCVSVTSVEIPDSVINIGNYAFSECSGLNYVQVGNNVAKIGIGAFSKCSNISSIEIPDSVITIERNAFSECKKLSSVQFGNGVTYIGDGAFASCEKITSITIPKNLENIGSGVFKGCYNLEYNEYNNCLYLGTDNNPYYLLVYVKSTSSINYSINSKTKVIADAFAGCYFVKSIVIPNGVIGLGNSAFSDCRHLLSISIPNSVISIGSYAFFECKELKSIKIPQSVKSIGEYAFSECYALTSIEIPDSITVIESWTFFKCKNLTSVILPDSVTKIEKFAFELCSGLTSIKIPIGITNIERGVFASCSKLAHIDIPDGVTTIDALAFASCSELEYIVIPDSVTSIGENAFNHCWALENVFYGGSEDQWMAISIEGDREFIDNATIVYNYG